MFRIFPVNGISRRSLLYRTYKLLSLSNILVHRKCHKMKHCHPSLTFSNTRLIGFVLCVCGLLFYMLTYYDMPTVLTFNKTYPTETNVSSPISFVARYFDFENSKLNIQGFFTDNNPNTNVILQIDNLPPLLFKNLRDVSNSTNSTTNGPTVFDKKKLRNGSSSENVLSKTFVIPPRKTVFEVSCPLLFSGDSNEQNHSSELLKNPKPLIPLKTYNTCDEFKHQRSYITDSLTKEEKDFPIAFSLLIFKEIEQVERLLRAIYRPQNFYCIHIDKKAKKEFLDRISWIADCFDNVFITNRSVDVQWGMFSVMEPELICMEELWRYKTWKYFINLTGQEFPLRTNAELVKILKVYNGTNDMEGTVKRSNPGRWKMAGEPPAGIRPVKGSVHITVNRDFVDYVLHNDTAQQFINWSRNVEIPDETFFTSLNHNPHLGIRGSYKGEPETSTDNKPFLTRFKNWGNGPFDWPCEGKRVRLICIFGVGDLPLLRKRPEFFANKFYWDFEPFALDCMEELLYNRTRDGYYKITTFDTKFYENLEFVKNRVF